MSLYTCVHVSTFTGSIKHNNNGAPQCLFSSVAPGFAIQRLGRKKKQETIVTEFQSSAEFGEPGRETVSNHAFYCID